MLKKENLSKNDILDIIEEAADFFDQYALDNKEIRRTYHFASKMNVSLNDVLVLLEKHFESLDMDKLRL